MRAKTQSRKRVGEYGIPCAAAQSRHRRDHTGWGEAGPRTAYDPTVLVSRNEGGHFIELCRGRDNRAVLDGSSLSTFETGSVGGRRLQRLAERDVDMDGSFTQPVGRSEGSCRQRAQVSQRYCGRGLFRQRGIHGPQEMIPVHFDLVDGLVSPAVTQFRGAVCREQEQRHAGHVCLDDGGVELQGCGAGGADQGDRPTAGLGQSQSKEAGAAFVEMQEGLDFGVGVEGKRQWCRA